jgi:hypothetical protein
MEPDNSHKTPENGDAGHRPQTTADSKDGFDFHTGIEFPTTVFGYPGSDPIGWLHLFPPVDDQMGREGGDGSDGADVVVDQSPDFEDFGFDDIFFKDGNWIEIGEEPGPMGPPPPPEKPKPLPPITEGPKRPRDKAVNNTMVRRLKGNSSDPLHRTLERLRVGEMYERVILVLEGMKFRARRIKQKYSNCSGVVRWTFYALDEPYWGAPAFSATQKLIGAGGALDGMKAGRFVCVGTLVMRRYQDVGAIMHIHCGERVIAVDFGKVHSELVREVSFANYRARGWFAGMDSTKSGGSFNHTMLRWDEFPRTPKRVPKKYHPGVTTTYSFGG